MYEYILVVSLLSFIVFCTYILGQISGEKNKSFLMKNEYERGYSEGYHDGKIIKKEKVSLKKTTSKTKKK